MGRRKPHNEASEPKAGKPKPLDYVQFREEQVTKNAAPADLDCGLDWYLVYTAPRMEAKAAKGLQEAGCTVFWPSLHRIIRHRRRRLEHDVSTFPRYLFVSGVPSRIRSRDYVADDGQTVITVKGRPIADIRDIDGVLDIVRTSRGWEKVPGKAIAKVAAFQNDATPPRPDVLMADPRLEPGSQVKVISGPFMSFQATVVESIGLRRAGVLIDILGGQVPVEMDIGQLSAA